MTSKEIRRLANDPELNPHGLSFITLYHRLIYNHWSLDKALGTPSISRSQAGRNARRNPTWNNFHLS